MKKTSLLLGLSTLLLLSGCGTGLSVIDYNNEVVEHLNATSNAIEETTLAYDQSVPNIVTEASTVDTDFMFESYKEAQSKLSSASKILDMQSVNSSQQSAVTTEMETYLDLGTQYLNTYNDMIDYYENGDHQTNLDRVAELDDALHTQYNDLIESNNALVDILEEFI